MFSSHAQDLCTSLLRLWGGNEFWKICKQTKSSEQQGKLWGYIYKCSQTSVPEDWRWRSSSNEIRIWKCHIFKKRRMAGWWEGGTGSFSSSPSICSLVGHSSWRATRTPCSALSRELILPQLREKASDPSLAKHTFPFPCTDTSPNKSH